MIWTAVMLLLFSLFLGVAAWLFFVWGVKSGQFDDIEGPKYRIFDDDEEENLIGRDNSEGSNDKIDAHPDQQKHG
nr:cbb3-type cytochrome oxidase assembly protein CcoS [Desulfobulbaceae bacterium]